MEAPRERVSVTALLSIEELSALEHGLPRLSERGEDLLVPFPVQQLRSARVLWLNNRWFLERGFDVTDTDVLARVHAWLVETFGYIAPEPWHKRSVFTDKTTVAHADRYGSSSGLAKHGGSGRVAVYGCFQAKGVGATPLVGEDAPADHSNGCVSIGEAIREVIYAEVMSAEFPHGAIPVIALLDTGLHYAAPEPGTCGMQKVRRALIVRPSVLRPAHAERAPLFRRSVTGHVNVQKSDVNRARDIVRQWLRLAHDGKLPTPRESMGRLAEQVAFGHVHRLYSGGIFSSNMAITGELHDFGNAYALPDWVRAKVLPNTPGFGSELEAIGILARSMDFHLRKYADSGLHAGAGEEFIEHAKVRYRSAFARECLRIWQAESLAGTESGRQIVELLGALYRAQQHAWRRYGWSGQVVAGSGKESEGAWLYDALVAQQQRTTGSGLEAMQHIVEQIHGWLRRGFESMPDAASRLWVSRVTACRMLRPRHGIDRSVVLQRIANLVSRLNFAKQDCAEQVADLIRTSIHQGRAHWPRLPAGFGVLAQAAYDGCTALLCSRGPGSPPCWWLEGISLEGRVLLFGNWVSLDTAERCADEVAVSGRYCSFLVQGSGMKQGMHSVLRLGHQEIRIPAVMNCVPPGMTEAPEASH